MYFIFAWLWISYTKTMNSISYFAVSQLEAVTHWWPMAGMWGRLLKRFKEWLKHKRYRQERESYDA
jgi:hypothetical protein